MKDQLLKNIESLIEDVMKENAFQLKKWGVQDHDISWWMVFLTEEVGELSQAIGEKHFRGGTRDEIHNEAIQVATLALKIAEMIKIDEWGL